MSVPWYREHPAGPDRSSEEAARQRQARLTKPPGSLGRLEDLAVRFAGFQGRTVPELGRVSVTVFAADHGVAERGVSAFPQSVTAAMLRNFSEGGAAINALARRLGADLEVVDLGTTVDPGPLPGVIPARIAAGTASFDRGPAMDGGQLETALSAGRDAAERARETGAGLFIGGEMGIASSTSATALACALSGSDPDRLIGPGSGLDGTGLARKSAVVREALERHGLQRGEPLEALKVVGGFEIAALAGAYVRAAQAGLPSLVDGFIATTAALAAAGLNPGVQDWLIFGHRSAEPGHGVLLEALGGAPLLDLGMRLGEGSGAAPAAELIRSALALHKEMATFQEAGLDTE